MRRAPRRAALLTARTVRRLVYQGGLFGGAALASFLLADATGDLGTARTAAFLTLAAAQVLHAFSVRTRRFAFSPRATRNPALLAVAAGTLALVVGLMYLPVVGEALDLEPLGLGQLLTASGIAVIPFIVIETIKAVRRATLPRIAT
jgi:Ca2+-transporting ATPase